jgi:hypothetical protein
MMIANGKQSKRSPAGGIESVSLTSPIEMSSQLD